MQKTHCLNCTVSNCFVHTFILPDVPVKIMLSISTMKSYFFYDIKLIENAKILFLHLEKNAGTSIMNWLDGYANHHNDYSYLVHKEHNEWKRLRELYDFYRSNFCFCVVRNPWSRLVSRYKNDKDTFLKKYMEGRGDYFLSVYTEMQKGFAHWLHNDVYKIEDVDYKAKWQNQCEVIDYCDHMNILRFETLEEDFKKVQDHLNWNMPLPFLNVSRHDDWKEYYDAETKQLVTEKYSQDIEQYRFTFD